MRYRQSVAMVLRLTVGGHPCEWYVRVSVDGSPVRDYAGMLMDQARVQLITGVLAEYDDRPLEGTIGPANPNISGLAQQLMARLSQIAPVTEVTILDRITNQRFSVEAT